VLAWSKLCCFENFPKRLTNNLVAAGDAPFTEAFAFAPIPVNPGTSGGKKGFELLGPGTENVFFTLAMQ
jgi:hypothetical protein